MASRDNSSAAWTYSTEVSPTGPGTPAAPGFQNVGDPLTLLHILVNMQNQQLELLRQMHEMQRLQLEMIKESTQINRDQRGRQIQELERWHNAHERILEPCKETLAKLEQVHAALLGEAVNYVEDNHENLLDADYSLSDFTDRFGPRLAHLNTILSILRPIAAAQRKPEDPANPPQ